MPKRTPIHNSIKYNFKKEYDDNRLPSHLRGYDTEWHKLRNHFLRKHPLCNRCNNIAEMVHHKIPIKNGGERLSIDNLESLCRKCHEKTKIQIKY